MPSISSTPKALPLGKMIVFITIRVGDAICPRASHFSPSEGTHENPALATCVGGTSWVTLGEQTRVICRECRREGVQPFRRSSTRTPSTCLFSFGGEPTPRRSSQTLSHGSDRAPSSAQQAFRRPGRPQESGPQTAGTAHAHSERRLPVT